MAKKEKGKVVSPLYAESNTGSSMEKVDGPKSGVHPANPLGYKIPK